MKKYLISIVFLLIFIIPSEFAYADYNYPFSAGIGIFGKGGINTSDPPEGIFNVFSFHSGIDVQAMVYLPMSTDSRTGVFLELAYANVPYGLKERHINEYMYVTQKWLNISPILMMNGFLIGLDFGFDIADDVVDDKHGLFIAYLPKSKADFNVNLKFGYMYPVKDWEVGVLNFHIFGTYNVTGADYGNHTYTPVTLGLGLNFLFNLERKSLY